MGISLLINGIFSKLMAIIVYILDGIARLINGLTRLINGWGGPAGAPVSASLSMSLKSQSRPASLDCCPLILCTTRSAAIVSRIFLVSSAAVPWYRLQLWERMASLLCRREPGSRKLIAEHRGLSTKVCSSWHFFANWWH